MRSLILAALAASCLAACEADGLSRSFAASDAGTDPQDAGVTPAFDAAVPDAAAMDAAIEPEPPPATEPVYIHTGDTLYAYDPETNQSRPIGRFVTERGPIEQDMVDIAIDQKGRMFGGTRRVGGPDAGPNDVYQIDPSSGRATFRFHFEDSLNGMTFLPTGELIVAGARVSVVDPEDGHVIKTLVGASSAYETSGDIVALPDGLLYWTVRGERSAVRGELSTDRVVRIDPRDGSEELIGDARVDRIFGLGYAKGVLYGFSRSGLVVIIEPESGIVLRQRELRGQWFGATTNPVLW